MIIIFFPTVTEPRLFEQEPDIANLNNLIAATIPDKWELFGAQLHIEQSTMNVIKRNNFGDDKLCFQYLFDEWKKSHLCPYTWSKVVKVLHSPSLKEYVLAEKVYKFVSNGFR